jgi:hypothetical protein
LGFTTDDRNRSPRERLRRQHGTSGPGTSLSLWAHLPRSPPAIQTSTHPSRPVLLTRRHSGRATREPAPRCCREPAAILPTSIAILHRTRRQLSHSSPTPAARPTTPCNRHRLACRQFLLGLRAGCGAERPAGGRVRQRSRCTPGRACPAGSVRRSTRRAPIRSGSGSAADLPATDGPQGPAAPEPTCDWWKVLVRSTVGVVACAPWGAVFGVAHVHRGSA